MKPQLDDIDRRLVNLLQDGLEICDEPFAAPALQLGITADDLLSRLARLKSIGVLSRVGPMYNAQRMGGGLSLCAMSVPPHDFDRIATVINGFTEVAHNYEREHTFNMWFVLATETPGRTAEVIAEMEHLTGIKVLDLPKLDEYFVGMKVEA